MHDGVVLGRFQPLHLGHLEYVREAKVRCDRLYLGVTNPDPETFFFDSADPQRSTPESNPFTFAERREMLEASLWDLGWTDRDFCIVPAPLAPPARLRHYLPSPVHVTAFLTVYDDWGDRKVTLMESVGFNVEVMWRRDPSTRITSGTQIRDLIATGGTWQHLVPPAVARWVERQGRFAG